MMFCNYCEGFCAFTFMVQGGGYTHYSMSGMQRVVSDPVLR